MDKLYKLTGKDLIALGLEPGVHFGKCLDILNAGDFSDAEIIEIVRAHPKATGG